MKKILATIMCLVMSMALLVGCGGNKDTDGDKDANKGLKIAIVSSPSGVDD